MKAPEEDRRTDGETTQSRTVRFVYGFSDDVRAADVLALCGGKGSGLMRMRSLGLPVPEGFVIHAPGAILAPGASCSNEEGLTRELLMISQRYVSREEFQQAGLLSVSAVMSPAA
jgi:hypothetical protein